MKVLLEKLLDLRRCEKTMRHFNVRYFCRFLLNKSQVSGAPLFRTPCQCRWNVSGRRNRFPIQILLQQRFASSNPELALKNRSVVLYISGGVILVLGASYAAVPAY